MDLELRNPNAEEIIRTGANITALCLKICFDVSIGGRYGHRSTLHDMRKGSDIQNVIEVKDKIITLSTV